MPVDGVTGRGNDAPAPSARSRPIRPLSSLEIRPVHRVLLVLFVLTLGVRSCHLANHLSGPLSHPEVAAPATDIAAFSVWAKQIADGDWLGRKFFHPVMDWMPSFGTQAEFERWWGGAEVFHQNPLYPYALAVSYLLTGSAVPLLILQVLGSSLSILLVFDLGRRLLDARAGLVAAGIAGLFAPTIVLDAVLLRASFNASLTLLSIWMLLRLRDAPGFRRGLGAGVVLAASFMLRPTGLALLVIGPLLLLLTCGASRRIWLRWLPALALGAVIVVAPFVARNLIVGAPALAFSTRGPETVIQANSKGAEPGFMSLPPPAEYRKLMDAGHGSLTRALQTSIDSWPDGAISWWFALMWNKTICVFRDYEYSNNINFYFYRRATPLLGLLPGFGWFVGLGLVGVVLLWRHRRDSPAYWLLLLGLAALYGGSVLGFALGRYRAPLAVLMTIPAGATVSLVYRWWCSGDRRRILLGVVAALAALGLSVLSFTVLPVRTGFDADGRPVRQAREFRWMYEGSTRLRPQEFGLAARALFQRGAQRAATQVLEEYLDEFRRYYVATEAVLVELPTAAPVIGLRWEFKSRLQQVAALFTEFGDGQRARHYQQIAEQLRLPEAK